MSLFKDYSQKSYLLFTLRMAGSNWRHPGYAFMFQSNLHEKHHETCDCPRHQR